MPSSNKQKARRAENFWGSTWRLVRYLKPWRSMIWLVIAMTVVALIFQIVTPAILGQATTVAYDGVKKALALKHAGHSLNYVPINFTKIIHILLIAGGMYIVTAIMNSGQSVIMSRVSQQVVYRLRKDFKAKMERLPVSFYDQHPNGDIMSRMVNDMDNISTMLQSNLTQFINSVLMLVGVFFMMLVLNWQLTLVALLMVPASLLVTWLIAPRSQRFFARQQAQLGIVNAEVEENFGGHNIIKTFNREKEVIQRFEKANQNYYRSAWKAQFMSILMYPTMTLIRNLDYVLVAIVGGIQVTASALTLGTVQAFLQYTNMFSQPITQMASLMNTLQATIASAERIFKVLDEPEMTQMTVDVNAVNPNDKIVFDHVQFQYVPDNPLIKDFNLAVPRGSSIAVVGPTGAGKSTIINLLERFYDINGGSIQIDGNDTRNSPRKQVRSQMAMVLQDTWLFTGTIMDNIKYGREGTTDEQAIKAAKESRADEFIEQLPNGYQTILNESASNISQGQKQLLTIARAFVADPQILILDEATSSVDTRTEMLIQSAMDKLVENRTSFVVAHRLSTIQNADKIIVMNHGSIIEVGNHEELLAKDGFYANLYNSQFVGNQLE